MKKKILFLIPTLMHGGAEKVLVNLVNFLDLAKYDITIQSLFDCGVNKKRIRKEVRYKSNFGKIHRGSTWIMKLFSPETLYKKLIGEKYDIVISFLEGPTARIISGCPYQDTKKVAWIHIEQENRKNFARSFRSFDEATRIYNDFDEIICVAETVKKDFLSLFDCKTKVSVLYNVNDTEYIKEKALEKVVDHRFPKDGIPTFCSVAKITKTKGYERLARVHKILVDEGYKHRIIIIGKGEDEGALERYIKKANIQDSFFLLGFKENPYKYMEKCDGYICSSFREGFSTAVTEALVVGIPCISTECSGAKELLGDKNEFGIVVENSTEGLYQGIKLLLEHDKREMLKLKSKERGEQFSTMSTVREVERLLDTL